MVVILGVHGIGNYQPGVDPSVAAATLAQTWGPHLAAHGPQLTEVDLRISYYAHLLAADHSQGAEDTILHDPEIADLLAAWARQLGVPDEIAAGRTTQPVRQLCSWIATTFGLESAFVRRFVAIFLHEVHTYLHNPRTGVRRTDVRNSLADDIRRHHPHIIVAHSLGSVVAYETLWANADLSLETLITLGSPLGIPDVVFDRLLPSPASGRGARPPNIGAWINIADHGDLVAIPPRLSKRFDGLSIDAQTSIAPFGFHGVTTYLDAPLLGDLLTGHSTSSYE